jgi:hypothetical protein
MTGSGRKENTSTDDKKKCTTMSRIINDFGDLRDYLDKEYQTKVTETIRLETSPLQALVSNVQLSLHINNRVGNGIT